MLLSIIRTFLIKARPSTQPWILESCVLPGLPRANANSTDRDKTQPVDSPPFSPLLSFKNCSKVQMQDSVRLKTESMISLMVYESRGVV